MSLLDEYRGRAIADAETIAELRAECERLRVQFNNAEWEGTQLRADVAEALAVVRELMTFAWERSYSGPPGAYDRAAAFLGKGGR